MAKQPPTLDNLFAKLAAQIPADELRPDWKTRAISAYVLTRNRLRDLPDRKEAERLTVEATLKAMRR